MKKFRVWLSGQWLDSVTNDTYFLSNDGKTVWVGEDEAYDVGEECKVVFWTDQKDKNGKEIYEGDILDLDGYVNEVIFHESSWCLKFIKIDLDKWFKPRNTELNYLFVKDLILKDWEIIGNIYENKELLK